MREVFVFMKYNLTTLKIYFKQGRKFKFLCQTGLKYSKIVFKYWKKSVSKNQFQNTYGLIRMRLQDIAIFMFKIRNKLLPYNILELFSSSSSNNNLRNSDFHIQRVKTVKYGKHSPRFFWAIFMVKIEYEGQKRDLLKQV